MNNFTVKYYPYASERNVFAIEAYRVYCRPSPFFLKWVTENPENTSDGRPVSEVAYILAFMKDSSESFFPVYEGERVFIVNQTNQTVDKIYMAPPLQEERTPSHD